MTHDYAFEMATATVRFLGWRRLRLLESAISRRETSGSANQLSALWARQFRLARLLGATGSLPRTSQTSKTGCLPQPAGKCSKL